MAKLEKALEGALDRGLQQEQDHETKEHIRDALAGMPCKDAVNILLMMVTEYRWRGQFEKEESEK